MDINGQLARILSMTEGLIKFSNSLDSSNGKSSRILSSPTVLLLTHWNNPLVGS